MAKSEDQTDQILDTRSLQKVESKVQAKIDSGYTAPKGWLFRGLTFLFFSSEHHTNGGHSDHASDNTKMEDTRQILACNTARFAAANIVTSLQSRDLTHVIVNPETTSSTEISSLRKSLAGKSVKVPHVVSCGWVEESWEHGTLLDEESKFCLFLYCAIYMILL
jgi:DNA ligase 4